MIFEHKVIAAPANTSFTDEQFYNCIIVKLNTDGFNSVYDRDATTYEVTKEELESITVLKCNESNILNVSGIELLKNLTDLNLSDNAITTINLGNSTKITNLLLSNNKLSSIDLTKNTAIENLYLNGNNLASLDLSKNTNLLVLNVNNNKLSSLNLENNAKLMDLKATESAFATQTKYLYKGDSLSLTPDIKFSASNETAKDWLVPTWITKDANIATVNQKGSVSAAKGGNVNVVASVEDIYSITYNVVISEISSETYNIDDVNATIAVDNANIQTILNNIKVNSGEAMIYNASNKYVTSGNISTGFKLKIMQDAKVLKTYDLVLVNAVVNNDLESLEVKDYSIEFDKDTTNYTLIVENDVEKIDIDAKAVESSAKVTIEGNEELVSGSNIVTITVTGTDKTTKTYTINVIKKAKENEDTQSKANVYLDVLEIKNYSIKFDQKVDFYTIKLEEDVTALEIKAEPVDNQATIKINGNKELKNGSKIEIIVSAIDGTSKTYTISIQKNETTAIKGILVALELIALLLLVILCIILIKKHNKKVKKSEKPTSKVEKDAKKETKKAELTEVEEQTIKITKTLGDDFNKSETHLEKTIRFRRVCPKCGSINVLTNNTCYLCGEKLDED